MLIDFLMYCVPVRLYKPFHCGNHEGHSGAQQVSDILTREVFLRMVRLSPKHMVSKHDAALRAVIQQAVEDVEKMDHGEMCQSNADWRNPPPCNCGHDAAIAKLKKGL